jgi:hypothetical protein
MKMLMHRQLELYRLPPIACPALDHIITHLRLRSQQPATEQQGD